MSKSGLRFDGGHFCNKLAKRIASWLPLKHTEKKRKKSEDANNWDLPYLQDYFEVVSHALCSTANVWAVSIYLQKNDRISFSFLVILWPCEKIRVISSGIKIYSLVAYIITTRLKEIVS